MQSNSHSLKHLNDQDLMTGLQSLVRDDQRLGAELLAHLAEVDVRRLYLAEAAPSLFAYCVEVLHLAEDAAYKRITAARAARSYPVIFELVAQGELHLSAVCLLAPQLTAANHRELCAAARGKSKRAVEQLLAERFPRPDVTTILRKLPAASAPATPLLATLSATSAPSSITTMAADGPAMSAALASESVQTVAYTAEPAVSSRTTPASSPKERGVISPLCKERYRLQLTVSGATRDKLLRARDLLLHKHPDGDLAAVLDEALTRLCDELERHKYGKLKTSGVEPSASAPPGEVAPGRVEKRRPERPAASSNKAASRCSRAIPRVVRRAVAERDGHQCSFVAADGRRCSARGRLEYHHLLPFARGGQATVANTTLRCKAHNLAQAVMDFGLATVRARIELNARRQGGGRHIHDPCGSP